MSRHSGKRSTNTKRSSSKDLRSSQEHLPQESAQLPIERPAPLRDLTGDLDDAFGFTSRQPRGPRSSTQTKTKPPKLGPELRAPKSEVAAKTPQDTRAALRSNRALYDSTDEYSRRADYPMARPYLGDAMVRHQPPAQLPQHPATMIAIMVVSLLIIFTLWGNHLPIVSRWWMPGSAPAESAMTQLFGTPCPAGDSNLQCAPSLSAADIDTILASYGSPATGTGQIWFDLGRKYGIDPAFAVAFFIHESTAGTNAGWAGMKADGSTTHNVGNIICAGYDTCHGRFRDYNSWEEGIEDWYRLIDVEYIKGRGTVTVEQIIPIYAPSFENDVQGYINVVTQLVDNWRTNGVS